MAYQTHINSVITKQVNNFHSASQTESKSETGSFKLTTSQKMILKQIADEQRIGMSQLVNNAIELYLELLPHADVLRENIEVFKPMFERIR